MTKQKNTKRALLFSALSLLMCVSMLIGSTFAWFTDSVTSAGNKIVAGTLNIDMSVMDENGTYQSVKENSDAIFGYTLWEPGYTEWKNIKVSTSGNLALKYVMNIAIKGERSILEDVIDVYYAASEITKPADRSLDGLTRLGTISDVLDSTTGALISDTLIPDRNNTEDYATIVLKMQESAGNDYQGKTIGEFDIQILATQLTYESDSFGDQYDKDAEYPKFTDAWDGTADTSWYNDTDTEFVITTAEQLAGLAELVDAGNSFVGKTIRLGGDLDLYYVPEGATEPKSFDPIGDDVAFEGTFDGQGNTIDNLYQSGWAFGYEWGKYGSVGLFGELKSATIKNVTISGAESFVEGGDVGGITGSATGDCVFENITLKDSIFATYNNGNGGIIGWSGAGNYTFKNITIGEDVVLAGLWGSFDSSIGGVVGQGEPGATYNFENVDIACRIDAYNDCTASYDYYNYRMCGMIIGRLAKTTTIDGVNYPDVTQYTINCDDVTVTYGDWANYHYCEPTPGLNGGRGMRVEPGYAYDGLPADFDHSQCVDNHMNLIPFDQIFGGDQLGVKGLKSYNGVNVIYNNK